VISSLTGADGLVEIPLDCAQVREGDLLNFIPFQEQVL
jgi:molybdopterin biosynthesis enzyme